jgi:tetratricopeptide (TPR) repeat protein
MKNVSLLTIAGFLLATGSVYFCVPHLNDVQKDRHSRQWSVLREIPLPIIRVLSLEFKGIVSDLMLLDALAFYGESISEMRDISTSEWQYFYRRLSRIADLDPRFWDTYLLAESVLAWDAKMYEEVNSLLEKAAKYRPKDYQPYFYIGFNYFFFLKDGKKAAPYLRRAAALPGAPVFLPGLAARVSLQADETKAALLFLGELISNSNDPFTRNHLIKRFQALKIIHDLEEKIVAYINENDNLPDSLLDLVKTGLIDEIPQDPYGGEFILLDNGRVYTTSELHESAKPSREAQQK